MLELLFLVDVSGNILYATVFLKRERERERSIVRDIVNGKRVRQLAHLV